MRGEVWNNDGGEGVLGGACNEECVLEGRSACVNSLVPSSYFHSDFRPGGKVGMEVGTEYEAKG